LVTVPTKVQLGEWCGLCKIGSEGKPKNVVPTSCAVVVDYGEESPALNYLLGELYPTVDNTLLLTNSTGRISSKQLSLYLICYCKEISTRVIISFEFTLQHCRIFMSTKIQ